MISDENSSSLHVSPNRIPAFYGSFQMKAHCRHRELMDGQEISRNAAPELEASPLSKIISKISSPDIGGGFSRAGSVRVVGDRRWIH
jgi:hypothetical protein